MKKSLKGFVKTKHFIQRQKERQVTDRAVVKAIRTGKLVENEDGHNFWLGDLKVTVDPHYSTLITVHPGDPSTLIKKVLGKTEAQELRKLIENHEASKLEAEAKETDEFLKYVADHSIKKI